MYCSRTVPEINKALQELKHIVEYRQNYSKDSKDLKVNNINLLAIGLTSRRNLCIHPQVS